MFLFHFLFLAHIHSLLILAHKYYMYSLYTIKIWDRFIISKYFLKDFCSQIDLFPSLQLLLYRILYKLIM